MLPYTSMDMLHAMQREWFEDERRPANPNSADATLPDDRGNAPDPLGLLLAKLLSGNAFGGGTTRPRRTGTHGAV